MKNVFLPKKIFNKPLKAQSSYGRTEYVFSEFTCLINLLAAKSPVINGVITLPYTMPLGTKLLLKTIVNQANFKYKHIFYDVLTSAQELGDKLKSVDFKKNQQIEWIVQPEGDGVHVHMVPMHCRIKNGELLIVITDSAGEREYSSFELIHKAISESLPAEHHKNITIYFYKPRRQADETSCSAISVRDVLEFSKHPELFDEIDNQANRIQYAGKIPVNLFYELPPYMMKVAQSESELTKYLQHQEEKIKLLRMESKKSSSLTRRATLFIKSFELQLQANNLKKIMQKHTFKVQDKSINHYARQRFFKYQAMIIVRAFSKFDDVKITPDDKRIPASATDVKVN